MNFVKSLDLAIRRCEGDYSNWQFFYYIYPFTTENIGGYIDLFDLKDKSLLTVGSSCDQVLNAILMGVKKVTLLDINPFTKYYYYLKVASIMELGMDEYLLFLRYNNYPNTFDINNHFLNKQTFDKISSLLRILDYESFLFWDELLQMFTPKSINSRMFSDDEANIINQCNPYLNDSISYDNLRNKILKSNVNFITDDIIHANVIDKYDNIWLSNIFATGWNFDNISKACEKFNCYLNKGGSMMIGYLYDTTIKTKYNENWPDIYNLDFIFSKLSSYNPKIKTFPGVRGFMFKNPKIGKDSILLCKKRSLSKNT